MFHGGVPSAAVAVMVVVEPGHSFVGGVIVQVGSGVPDRVVLVWHTQIVPAGLPGDESETYPEQVTVTPAADAAAVNVRLLPTVGPATTTPFLVMAMVNAPVPPAPVTVMSWVEPGHSDAGGVSVQVGIGVPAKVVEHEVVQAAKSATLAT